MATAPILVSQGKKARMPIDGYRRYRQTFLIVPPIGNQKDTYTNVFKESIWLLKSSIHKTKSQYKIYLALF